jgi:hypothetical protein
MGAFSERRPVGEARAWAVAGARRLALALAHALGPGAAALALGRRRLGTVLAALHLAAALVAHPALEAYAPPLTWGAWRWHLALVVAWAALVALPAAAYLLGWDRARAARLRPRAFLGALALGAALCGTALAAVDMLPGALGAPEWMRVRPTDNAAAPNFPQGKTAIVMRDWWKRHPVGRGDLVHLEAADLPPERAAFAGIARVIALPGDTVHFINSLPVVNGFIASHLGTTPTRSWPDPEGRGHRFDHYLVGEQLGEGWPRHRVVGLLGGAGRAARGPSGARRCLVPRGHVVVLRDNRPGSRFEQDSRAGYRGDIRNDCPVMVPMEAVRHRPTILSADPYNREYDPPKLRP